MGLLGAFTRVKLKLHKVESGSLRVKALAAKNLDAMFDTFEENLPESDYLVGWVDCAAGGSGLGRGEIHRANYLKAGEDPLGAAGFDPDKQDLPSRIFGIPKSQLWRFMQPFMNNLGVPLVNTAKYHMARLAHGKTYHQSHVAFAFLLDYVPDWRLAYGPEGFIQYQVFIPKETARQTLKDILALCRERSLPSYLGVLKRHRPDAFLLSHAVDGYSLAMDFRVTKSNRERLWQLTHDMTDRVLDAGGRFYMAKDAVLRPGDLERAYGASRLDAFRDLKARLDPDNALQSDLSRRVMPSLAAPRGTTGATLAASVASDTPAALTADTAEVRVVQPSPA
ncbi:FAD-binding oxidoreductase [bacterium]|nr:MAG: FAD-binding oxidoreductase [bacterium]